MTSPSQPNKTKAAQIPADDIESVREAIEKAFNDLGFERQVDMSDEHHKEIGVYVAQSAVTALIEKGWEAEGWLPIECAPETGENYLGIIEQPDGSFGEPFVCFWDIDEHHICLHQTEARLHRPTHWQTFPLPPQMVQVKRDGEGGGL